MMPLQYIYTMALEQDIKNSHTSRKMSDLIQHRCYHVGLCISGTLKYNTWSVFSCVGL